MSTVKKQMQQRGAGILGALCTIIVIVFIVLLVIKVAPTVAEYFAMKRVIGQVVDKGTDMAIRNAYDEQAGFDGMRPPPVDKRDLEISFNGDKATVSFAYDKEIHLFGPAYLTIKYSASRTAGSYK